MRQDLKAEYQAPLQLFYRQYLQLESHLTFPPAKVLQDEAAQEEVYERLYAPESLKHPVPRRFALRILKQLLARIQASIDDWEAYGVSDNLASALADYLAVPLADELSAAQQPSYVTYHQSILSSSATQLQAGDHSRTENNDRDFDIVLLESRSLISAEGTTGLRTWDASFHLGRFLCKNPEEVRGKTVLELGAGTGYLSVLCAKFLGVQRMIASDGSQQVLGCLKNNLCLNGVEEWNDVNGGNVVVQLLEWGLPLNEEDRPLSGFCPEGKAIDVVIGADITYNVTMLPALFRTLEELWLLYPGVHMLFAAMERNEKTVDELVKTCNDANITLHKILWKIPRREAQRGPFYDDSALISIFRLSKGLSAH